MHEAEEVIVDCHKDLKPWIKIPILLNHFLEKCRISNVPDTINSHGNVNSVQSSLNQLDFFSSLSYFHNASVLNFI